MSTHHGILIHSVFSTKFRKPYLRSDWRDDLFGYMGGIVRDQKSTLLAAGGTEGHVHLLIKLHPEIAISKLMQTAKANSSRWINEERKLTGKFAWQRGYGVFSVSQSMVEAVRSYIANQVEYHRQQSFQDEYLSILKKHKIEFDPKFVFESEIIG